MSVKLSHAKKSVLCVYSLMFVARTNLKTDQEQFIRSDALTARPLISVSEHKRATRKGDLNNNIAENHLKTSHTFEWDSATCLA